MVAALIVTFRVMARASKGYTKARERTEALGPAIPCSTCHSTMDFLGVSEFAAEGEETLKGMGGGSGSVPLEVHRCPTCRKVEFFLPPSAG